MQGQCKSTQQANHNTPTRLRRSAPLLACLDLDRFKLTRDAAGAKWFIWWRVGETLGMQAQCLGFVARLPL